MLANPPWWQTQNEIPLNHIYLVRYSGPYGLKSSTNQVPWTIVQNNKNQKSFRMRSWSKIYRMYANKHMWCVYSIFFPVPFFILVSFQAERTQSLPRDSRSSVNGSSILHTAEIFVTFSGKGSPYSELCFCFCPQRNNNNNEKFSSIHLPIATVTENSGFH